MIVQCQLMDGYCHNYLLLSKIYLQLNQYVVDKQLTSITGWLFLIEGEAPQIYTCADSVYVIIYN